MIRRVSVGVLILLFSTLCEIAFGEEAQRVSVCDLKNDPASFNHKLVQVTTFASHGFEDFTLQDPTCDSTADIWLDYGGTAASGTVYCCGGAGERTRPKEMVVENIAIPLVDDKNFREFDNLLHGPGSTYQMVHASLVGRFFSGQQVSYPSGQRWSGYGHMGCCSLLVIQQVLSVDKRNRQDVDYSLWAEPPNLDKFHCRTYRNLTPEPYASIMQVQAKAESGDRSWSFDDPQRVAREALGQFLKVDPQSIVGLRPTKAVQGRKTYEWHSRGKSIYLLIVDRPYWLSFYSHEEGRIVWVLQAAYEVCGN